MTSPFLAWRPLVQGAGVVLLLWPLLVRAHTDPTSKFYVADVRGESFVQTASRLISLDEKSVYPAQGAIIVTSEGASNAIVLSNGTGLALGSNTRLEMRRFVQEPFRPNRANLETEPSVSHTLGVVSRGSVGICTAQMVAGSTMTFQSALGSAAIRGGKLLLSVTDEATVISLIDGDITVRVGERDASGQALRGGQQIVIRRVAGAEPAVLVQNIPAPDLETIDEQLTLACIARRTVYFDTTGNAEDPLVAVPLTPIRTPDDVTDDNRLSPSFIGNGSD